MFSVKTDRKNLQKEWHQLLAHGRWFSTGTPASSTTKTGRHDIAEILLKAKPITNTAWVRTRLCKLQKRVHSTRSRK
jgi:hypothetical protein